MYPLELKVVSRMGNTQMVQNMHFDLKRGTVWCESWTEEADMHGILVEAPTTTLEINGEHVETSEVLDKEGWENLKKTIADPEHWAHDPAGMISVRHFKKHDMEVYMYYNKEVKFAHFVFASNEEDAQQEIEAHYEGTLTDPAEVYSLPHRILSDDEYCTVLCMKVLVGELKKNMVDSQDFAQYLGASYVDEVNITEVF